MEQILLPILVFVAVIGVGSAVLVAVGSRRKAAPRLQAIDGRLADTGGDPGLIKVVSKIGGAAGGRGSLTLKEQLARAGYFGESAAATYVGVKLLLLVIGICGATTLFLLTDWHIAIRLYAGLLAAALLFFLPNIIVDSRKRRRRYEVRSHLPDVVDLLEICVTAGMGLDSAWNSVADEIRGVSPIMADEMALTTLEMQLGATRTSAMRNMAERTGAQELSSLVALLVQSDRFGTSISDALRTFATSLRDARSQRAEETAEKMAVKLLFPLVLFIFPVMIIVTCGPTAITLYRIMSK